VPLPPTLSVRRNFNSLDPAGPDVAALRAGIAAMRAMDPATGNPTNPRSWGYQRAIHGTTATPLALAWNTCTHSHLPTAAFLSWHRAYLAYFERVCRAASGNAAFNLPYWNYDLPGQNVLPTAFRDATPANQLFQAGRGINDGSVLTAVGEQSTITEPDFDAFHDALHNFHDSTHGGIGGVMGSVASAALDPIFYLHHCNIDRCWRHWQLSHLGNADPSPLPPWWGSSWQFFDETGAPAAMTGQQAEHTPNLGYVYDDEPRKVRPGVYPKLPPIIVDLCRRFPDLCHPRPLPQGPWPLPLVGPRPTPLPIRMTVAQVQGLWAAKRDRARAFNHGLLELQLVLDWREGAPNIVVEARPAGSPDDTGWIPAGMVGSFSRGGARDTVNVDVTQLFSRLDQRSASRELEWRLRFSSGRASKDGREHAITADDRAQARVLSAQLMIPQPRQ
jgi:hypothetical protein